MYQIKGILVVLLMSVAVLLGSWAEPNASSKCSATPSACDGWQGLLASDLSNCVYAPGSWMMEDGVLTRMG